jgi:hypothetical protein
MIFLLFFVASTALHVSPSTAAVSKISVRSFALNSLGFAGCNGLVKGNQAALKTAPRMSSCDLSLPRSSVEHLKGAKADIWLKAMRVDFKVIEQSKATSKCRDSALERGVSLRQIVKSIVFIEQSEYNSGPTGPRMPPRVLQAMLPGALLLAPQPAPVNRNFRFIVIWQETSRSLTPR